MQIETVEIDSILPYEHNAKAHPEEQLKKLAANIAEFGLIQPIVVDSNNWIVAGHGRWMAAKRAGLRQVPIYQLPADVSEEKIRALRLFDNRIAETTWDHDLLTAELQALAHLGSADLEAMTAFGQAEIEDMISISSLPDLDLSIPHGGDSVDAREESVTDSDMDKYISMERIIILLPREQWEEAGEILRYAQEVTKSPNISEACLAVLKEWNSAHN